MIMAVMRRRSGQRSVTCSAVDLLLKPLAPALPIRYFTVSSMILILSLCVCAFFFFRLKNKILPVCEVECVDGKVKYVEICNLERERERVNNKRRLGSGNSGLGFFFAGFFAEDSYVYIDTEVVCICGGGCGGGGGGGGGGVYIYIYREENVGDFGIN